MDREHEADIWRAARLMIAEFGDDVAPVLNQQVEEAFDRMDAENMMRWSQIRTVVVIILGSGRNPTWQ